MASVLGKWNIHSRAKKGSPKRVYSTSGNNDYWVLKDQSGYKADWYLQNSSKTNAIITVDGNEKSFILKGNATDDCTVRGWLITDTIMLGIATCYDSTAGLAEDEDKGDGCVNDEDVDVFVAIRYSS